MLSTRSMASCSGTGKGSIGLPPRQLLTADELSKVPPPYYDEVIRRKVNVAVIETSRGCPNDCDFCAVTQAYGREYRSKAIPYVIAGLRDVQEMGASVFFCDDNFVGSPTRAIALANAIAENGLARKPSTAQVTIQAARNPELLKALKRAGIEILCVGIESLFDETLTTLGKPYSAQQNKDYVRKLREEGFWVHGMLMPGGDGDTRERLQETSRWINENLDSVQLFPPLPIPGTRLLQKMREEGRILTTDYSLYDGQSVVMRPLHMSPYELQTTIFDMYRSFYSLRESAKRFRTSPQKKIAFGIWYYTQVLGGIRKVIHSAQTERHLEFLRSVS
jgi:radical SAM superfamily enzyme YgiQ (UPF0313 family)